MRGTILGMERVYTTPRLDKLGVKPGARVSIVGVPDSDLRDELAGRTHDVTDRRAAPGHRHRPPRRRLLRPSSATCPASVQRLVPNGAIWVVSRKGRSATLRDVDVIAAARASGLIDNKVASFSPTHTALRLVIPVALRPPARSTD